MLKHDLMLTIALCCLVNLLAGETSRIVQTTSGPVRGFEDTWSDGSVFNAWQGIPFGKPPVGDLRWKSPISPSPWTEVLDCTSRGTQCVQASGVGSEDCLYLNVYSTGNPTNEGPFPVLFYIYGGSLMTGAADENFGGFVNHAGAGEGIVVVEVGYRLNIIGFLAAAELSAEQGGVSGNYGIQDQILALEWVRDNIAKFNGDPNLVTIAGQSSGGTSVFSLLSAPSSRGLFHRAISLSGSPNITISMDAAERQNAHLVDKSGCRASEDSTSAEVVACLRGRSTKDLVRLIPLAWETPGLFGLPLSPEGEGWEGLVIVDGVTIPHPFDTALAWGNVSNNVPFMIGAMGQEPDEGPERDVKGWDADKWQQYLVEYFAPWDTALRNAKRTKTLGGSAGGVGVGGAGNGSSSSSSTDLQQVQTVGEAVFRLYQGELTSSGGDAQKAFDSIVSDYGQSCANVLLSRAALTGGYSAPIYHFVNQWHLSAVLKGTRPDYTVNYAFHVLDFHMLLEDWARFDERGSPYKPDARDLEGSQLLQSLWYSFMLTGNPTSPGVSKAYPGELPQWRAFSDTDEWPASYQTYVIQSDADQGASTGTVTDYQSDKCDYFHEIGISDKSFWWCN